MRDTAVPYCVFIFEGVGTLCGSNAFNVINGKSYCDHHAKIISCAKMNVVEEIKKYNEWYDLTVDSMRGIEAFTITELLQRAFSAGVKAAEQSMEARDENYK